LKRKGKKEKKKQKLSA